LVDLDLPQPRPNTRHRHLVGDALDATFKPGAGDAWDFGSSGPILFAARLGVERKKPGWQRRDDWGSHPQLAPAGDKPVRRRPARRHS
jgi:hypothetical protein